MRIKIILYLIVASLLYILINQYITIKRLRNINEVYSQTSYDYIRLVKGLERINKWDVNFIKVVEK